ncbi:aspartate aminotransferase [Dunaliella salina]|uniref:Aspartate aminotransferase n=1 Tax=Dunaliella salina TaxID=3046 RepID=A0ABQ7HAN0_DUNSA|nr:aspartate aminotransferase [Dunaliella salina]|eukprot:KAF5843910.1 aspartate aminotransferase [Dunaliella salina]
MRLRASKFDTVEMAPPDPILGVSEAFRACQDPRKLNLGVGAYRTEELQPFVLPVVKKAEQKIVNSAGNKEYLPIDGLPEFKKATVDLLLGADHPAIKEGRVQALQALSGTGALRVGAGFLSRYMKGTPVYISNPTWGNHRSIFADEGVEWRHYSTQNSGRLSELHRVEQKGSYGTKGGMLWQRRCTKGCHGTNGGIHHQAGSATVQVLNFFSFQQVPLDVLLGHCRVHVLSLGCTSEGHMPFFDIAYQGFASGSLDQDAAAPRLFVDMGLEILVSQSYSKNLGLWKAEMQGMAGRITRVRGELRKSLESKWPEKDWSFVTSQIGMFSFTGLSPAQVRSADYSLHLHCIPFIRDQPDQHVQLHAAVTLTGTHR